MDVNNCYSFTTTSVLYRRCKTKAKQWDVMARRRLSEMKRHKFYRLLFGGVDFKGGSLIYVPSRKTTCTATQSHAQAAGVLALSVAAPGELEPRDADADIDWYVYPFAE